MGSGDVRPIKKAYAYLTAPKRHNRIDWMRTEECLFKTFYSDSPKEGRVSECEMLCLSELALGRKFVEKFPILLAPNFEKNLR